MHVTGWNEVKRRARSDAGSVQVRWLSAVITTLRTALVVASLIALPACGSERDAPPPVAPYVQPSVTVATNLAGAELTIDGRRIGPLIDGQRHQLPAGPHVLEARRGDVVLARVEPTLRHGDSVDVRLDGPAPPANAAPGAQPEAQTATGGSASPPARDVPSRRDVSTAMPAVATALRGCGAASGSYSIQFRFEGATGKPREVQIRDASVLSPAVRTCMEQTAMGASLPPFRSSEFSFNYPFRL